MKLCALLVLVPALALGAETSGALRLTLLGGVDGNPRRDFGGGDSSLVGTAELSAQGDVAGERWELAGRLGLGGRGYGAATDEDVYVQQAVLEGDYSLARWLSAGLAARAKDVRGGDRPYADLSAGPRLSIAQGALGVDLSAEARRFLYRPEAAYSFGALVLSGEASYRFSRRHLGRFFLSSESRSFAAFANPAPPQTTSTEKRNDAVLAAGVGYRYRGPFTLAAEYSVEDDSSNSYGESALRQKVSAELGLRLPLGVMAFFAGTLQLSHYPDGVFLSPEILLLEDSEALDSASLRLVRPVGPHVDLELRYGIYATTLPSNGLSYLRQLASVGVTLRL